MTDQPPTSVPEPSDVPPPAGGDPVTLTPQPSRRDRRLWIVGGAVVLILLITIGVIAFNEFVTEDSGVAACKAIRDHAASSARGGDDEMTEAEYRQVRKLFEDSDVDDIRDHGTKLIDVLWQMQQLPKGEELAGLAFIGPLTTHAMGLQSACADQGVVFNLLADNETRPDPSADPLGEDQPSASAAPTEGSAANLPGRTATFPDGITLRLDRVQRMPRNLGYEIPANKAIIRVTWTFENTTSQPVPLEPATRYLTVLYGPNRVEGESESGYSTDDPAKQLQQDEHATRIAAGGKVTMFESSTVLVSGLAELAVQIALPQVPGSTGLREPYTFTEAEKMLTK